MTSDYIKYAVSALLLTAIILKTYLFFTSTSHRKFENWFFFDSYNLYNSHSSRSKKSKIFQNRLTFFVIAIAVIDIMVFIMFRS
ncbi:MAG: hypothetical protein ABJB05_07915 [Parafilimonas sp.]